MKNIIGITLIAPLLLANMQATTMPKPAPKSATPAPANPTVTTPAKPAATKPAATTTVADPEKKSDIPVVTLKKPGAPASAPVVAAIKSTETAEQFATRTGTNPDILCFMTLGTFSAVAGQNASERSDDEKIFLSKIDAATDFFMGRATARLADAAVEPAMKKAGALITADSLGPLSTPCMTYYEKKFAPIAAQIRPAPTPITAK